ncbi:fluconazole resistance protein 1 [Arthroderma uncinatum]|uniref:fluconazole resistance protein 1 n=1 Tax=Arthroderma uncinatum TaxID=74035 RepID=UPI00144AB951|nr:fluconazole resistance protein 1 [Arthroderma uncinatum]KAF3484359.1 fluconazole resistance protein 1 [Arthroderma uncinatum]
MSTADTSTDTVPLEAGPTEESKVADPELVDWDGPNDIENPHNWPSRKRWAHVVVVAIICLVMYVYTVMPASGGGGRGVSPTMCAPSINLLVAEFHIRSFVVSTLAVTLYLLGLAVGPMFISPLSEIYGRLPVYHISNIVFVGFVIGNALSKNIGQFLAFRFLSGCAGGTPMALGGGSIADVTPIERRAIAMALFSLGPLTGPVLGPVIGGFIAAGKGWRWIFWILAIIGAAATIVALVILRETHPGVILERKAARLRASTGNPHLRSKLARSLSPRQLLAGALVRPTMLLIRSPILLIISLYVALVFGLMYLLFTTFTDVFEGEYGFTTSTSGLVYLGLGVALVICMLLFGALNERVQAACLKADGATQTRPEYRLVLMIFFSPLVGVGLFIYGWTVQYKVHWIVPIIGTMVMGFGAFFVLMPAQLYLVDLFGSEAAASALGANNLMRYLSSTFLPLAGPSMYKTLHYGWGNTLLGFLALAFVPAPILFYKYGEWLRAKTAIKL